MLLKKIQQGVLYILLNIRGMILGINSKFWCIKSTFLSEKHFEITYKN